MLWTLTHSEMGTEPELKKIAIFASGAGSNAANIISYFNDIETPRGARVAVVVCNRQEAGVYDVAKNAGVPAVFMPRADINNEQLMLSVLDKHDVDIIVLAGFLLQIPDFIIHAYRDNIVNIHPALLPKFGGKGMYGSNVHRAVVEANESATGITIHHVSEHYDEGRIIFQATTEVTSDDTAETVEAKVHELEYKHYPDVIHRTFIEPGNNRTATPQQ